jgi:hypothetical protein
MIIEQEYGTCPVCGHKDSLVNEAGDGTKLRTCRNVACPMFYIPVDADLDVVKSLEAVGYEFRSECGDSYFLVKDDHGFLLAKSIVPVDETPDFDNMQIEFDGK